jgi:hypothetical protein
MRHRFLSDRIKSSQCTLPGCASSGVHYSGGLEAVLMRSKRSVTVIWSEMNDLSLGFKLLRRLINQ